MLQGIYNHLTKLQQDRKRLQIHGIFNLVATMYETRLLCYNQKFPYGTTATTFKHELSQQTLDWVNQLLCYCMCKVTVDKMLPES